MKCLGVGSSYIAQSPCCHAKTVTGLAQDSLTRRFKTQFLKCLVKETRANPVLKIVKTNRRKNVSLKTEILPFISMTVIIKKKDFFYHNVL